MDLDLEKLRYDLALNYAKVKLEQDLKIVNEKNNNDKSGKNKFTIFNLANPDNPYNEHAFAAMPTLRYVNELEAFIAIFGRAYFELSQIPDNSLIKKMGLTKYESPLRDLEDDGLLF